MWLRLPLRTTPRLWITRDRCIQLHFRRLHGYASKTQDPSSSNEGLTYSYLTSSCGLSSAAAFSVAQKFCLKNIEKADSFLSVLKEHGFTEAQIAQIITKAPFLLSSNAETSVKPKLEFLLSAGLPSAALGKIVSGNPFLLRSSLERRLRPNFNILKTFLGGAKEIVTAVCGATRLLQHNLEEDLLPNVKTLEEHGVPRNRIVKLATFYPRALLRSPVLFRKEAALLKEMGLDPLKATFVHGIVVFCGLNNPSRVRKLQLYRSLGWSEEDCTLLFKKFPFCLLFSDERIKRVTNFFVVELKWKHSFVAARPKLLSLSLDKTIIPRCDVYDILSKKGLLKKITLASCLQLDEKKFLDKCVIKYGEQYPELLDAYRIKLESIKLKEVNLV